MLNVEPALRESTTPALSENDSWPTLESGAGTSADWHDEANERSFQTRLGSQIVRIETRSNGIPEWLVGVIADLNSIARLPENWDSYGARRIPQRTLEHALQVIANLMDVGTPPPQVGATVAGGVEFEWNQHNGELEVQILTPYQVHAYFYNEETNEEWEDDNVGLNVDLIRPYLRHLSG